MSHREKVLPEYPRPQMVRSNNGKTSTASGITLSFRQTSRHPKNTTDISSSPTPWNPPCRGSASPWAKKTASGSRTTFRTPKSWKGRRVLLNFREAVDWETRVLVNGREAGGHKGGYDPFSFDVTDLLKKRGDQEVVVSVWDPIDEGTQPRGKQVRSPHGIWYTSVTGIWSTVWLEPVSEAHIRSFEVLPDLDGQKVRVRTAGSPAAAGLSLEVSVLDGSAAKAAAAGKPGDELVLDLPDAKPSSPDSPFLYGLGCRSSGRMTKRPTRSTLISGCAGIALGQDAAGILRLFLNGAPLFQFGPLDQGWWPDGLYTAPTDAALRYDIEMLKDLGFNMMRKHVKVEPRRFYYWCDKLGLLVWQDMPSGDAYIQPQDPDIHRTEESAKQYETEFAAVIKALSNQPCVVMWVPVQ